MAQGNGNPQDTKRTLTHVGFTAHRRGGQLRMTLYTDDGKKTRIYLGGKTIDALIENLTKYRPTVKVD